MQIVMAFQNGMNVHKRRKYEINLKAQTYSFR